MNEWEALEQRLGARFEALDRRIDTLNRRADQHHEEIRAKQDEDIMLLKAMSCQLRGRMERAERRAARNAS
jgi:hypothetical protein